MIIKNSIVCAHTGSGKTLPAEPVMNPIVDDNMGKVIYTSLPANLYQMINLLMSWQYLYIS